jgi:hypothetical protein
MVGPAPRGQHHTDVTLLCYQLNSIVLEVMGPPSNLRIIRVQGCKGVAINNRQIQGAAKGGGVAQVCLCVYD